MNNLIVRSRVHIQNLFKRGGTIQKISNCFFFYTRDRNLVGETNSQWKSAQ